MDVQCERCKTEYEFDDALVSGRGTTVRCTNCGHQFKVRKQEISEPGQDADRWAVRTGAGQDLTFLTLRELQRAILAKQVGRADMLRRGSAAARALGTIAELEPFFEGRASSRPPPPGAGSTVARMPPPAAAPRMMPEPVAGFPKRAASWGIPEDVVASGTPGQPQRQKIDTLRPPDTGTAAPPPPPPLASASPPVAVSYGPVSAAPVAGASPYASPHGAGEDPVTMRRPTPTPQLDMSSPLPPPTVPVQRRASYGDDDLPDMRRSLPSAPSSRDDDYPGQNRRRVGGWIVALVLLMAVGVVGWVVARPYLAPRAVAGAAALDPRAQAFINDGERAMVEGNLDGAQEAFDKASALAEHDPRVLVDEARVAAAKADVPWLKLRLLPPEAKEDIRETRSELAERVARARTTADAAVAVAPDDPAAIRAHIDALRLSGEGDVARKEVSRIIGQAAQAETAYVLAALDLSENEPLWTTLVDRLRVAAAGEGATGRARAALVYALAQSGDVAGARSELAKLDTSSRPYPLLASLHGFVARATSKLLADGGAGRAAMNVPHVDVSSLPVQPAPGAGAGGGAGGGPAGNGGEAPVPGETGGAMKAARSAIHKGDWNRARTIYEALVSRNPNDSEALAGLGDVARAQGDSGGALSAYRRALSVNPSYLPALLGVADTQWATGDRAGAIRAYKDIVDRFPEGTYPAYVKSRTEAVSAPAAASASAASGPPAASGAAAPAPSAAKPAPAASDGL